MLSVQKMLPFFQDALFLQNSKIMLQHLFNSVCTRTFRHVGMIAFVLSAQTLLAQDCESKVTIKLNNIKGGFYANQVVTLKSRSDGKQYQQTSNTSGEAAFTLPCDQKFDISIPNYTLKNEIMSPKTAGSSAFRNFSYEPDMLKKEELFAMSETEKATVDKAISTLPDTTLIYNSVMTKPVNMDNYTSLTISLQNLEKQPLAGERMIFTGAKRNKSFKGTTNAKGILTLYLPKGDEYNIHFKHNKNFKSHEVRYSKGIAEAKLDMMYLGTAEIERRKKIEEDRIKAEEKRLAEEKAAFVKWCKELKISEEEGLKRKLEESYAGSDPVVTKVFGRNKWSEKLIVCDLTGSMDPYANQLSAWYQLNYKLEKNLQFVFFNDGDRKSDAEKKIGSTGGIYYQKASSLDSLISLMTKVRYMGHGGDCPENNMEALIKGVKQSNPYKELIMIADNGAPVKDISMLKDFKRPVHIIVCGSNGEIHPDYLLIAWKTKGSVHTMEEDITKIASMMEDESIVIQGITYRIMGGEFVRVTKL